MPLKNFILKLVAVVFLLIKSGQVQADNIYLMNAPGYNQANTAIIDAMTSLGHTVTVETFEFDVLPAGFTSACIDPDAGYHWLCFFGDHDYSPLAPEVSIFISNGGKVYYNYEVSCCTTSSTGAAAMVAAITGLPITPNANDYISLGSATDGGWSSTLSGCIDIIGNAYKGFDNLPVANQLQAMASIAGASPDFSTCLNFGYFFTGADIPGNTLGGSITGMGDINVWFDGDEPGSGQPVNLDLVAYFFPTETTTCHLATTGCEQICPFQFILGPDQAICAGASTLLEATHPDAISYLWNDNSNSSTLNVSNAGTYWVEVSDGTETCRDTIFITVNTVIAVASPDVTICLGLDTDLSASGGATYSWSPSASLDNANINNPVAAPSVTTVYTVTVTTGNCSDTDDVTVTVVPASIDYDVNLIPAVCEVDGSIELTAVSGGQVPYTIQVDGTTVQVFDVMSLGAGNYTLDISDNTGCAISETLTVDDGSYNIGFTSVTVDPYCTIPGSIDLTNISNTQGNITYLLNNVAQPAPPFSGMSAGNYHIVISDENGCEAVDDVVLTLSAGNILADVLAQNPVCLSAGNIEVTNVANALQPFEITLNNNPDPSGIFNNLAQGNYLVKVTDAAGCIFQENISLVNQIPVLNAILDTFPQLCETPGRLNAVNISGGTQPYAMMLDNETLLSTGADIDNSEHVLEITDANGCFMTVTFSVGYLNHTEAMFIATPSVMHAPQAVVFSNLSENADEFQWDFGNGVLSEEEVPNVTFNDPGEFVVTLVATDSENGCVSTIQGLLLVLPPNTMYIPEAFTPDNDGINDVFRMEGQNIAGEDFDMVVFNRFGEVVWHATETSDVWTGSHQEGNYYVPDGAYPYILTFKYTDSIEPSTINGHIMVVR